MLILLKIIRPVEIVKFLGIWKCAQVPFATASGHCTIIAEEKPANIMVTVTRNNHSVNFTGCTLYWVCSRRGGYVSITAIFFSGNHFIYKEDQEHDRQVHNGVEHQLFSGRIAQCTVQLDALPGKKAAYQNEERGGNDM